jgi:uncharacterized damage-inducible protein DinB
VGIPNPRTHQAFVDAIAAFPTQIRELTGGLSEKALNTRFRNWTIRQIVHHVADSHVNSYVRFKWTLTEATPTIKAYDESRWSQLPEARNGRIEPSLILLDGLHQRWVQLMASMDESEFSRCFYHPESGETIRLSEALQYYAWHGQHHSAQIRWVRQQNRF